MRVASKEASHPLLLFATCHTAHWPNCQIVSMVRSSTQNVSQYRQYHSNTPNADRRPHPLPRTRTCRHLATSHQWRARAHWRVARVAARCCVRGAPRWAERAATERPGRTTAPSQWRLRPPPTLSRSPAKRNGFHSGSWSSSVRTHKPLCRPLSNPIVLIFASDLPWPRSPWYHRRSTQLLPRCPCAASSRPVFVRAWSMRALVCTGEPETNLDFDFGLSGCRWDVNARTLWRS